MTTDHPDVAAEALRSAIDDCDRRIEALQTKRDALTEALALLVPFVRPPNPAVPADPVVLPKVPRETRRAPLRAVAGGGPASNKAAAQQARAAQRVPCPECGKDCSLSGLGVHRSKAHGVRGVQSANDKRRPGYVAPSRLRAEAEAERKDNMFSVADAAAVIEGAG